MDAETQVRLNEVRKELYFGALRGLLIGMSFSGCSFFLASKYSVIQFKSPIHRKNMFIATILVGGSIGSFCYALANGKNSSQYIGDIYKQNANPSSSYLRQLNQNESELLSDDSYERRKKILQQKQQNTKINEHDFPKP